MTVKQYKNEYKKVFLARLPDIFEQFVATRPGKMGLNLTRPNVKKHKDEHKETQLENALSMLHMLQKKSVCDE